MTHSIRSISGILIFMLLFNFLSAQAWIDMMHDPEANYYETVDSFNAWWGNKEVTKSSGYKPFQRWAYHRSLNIDKDGKLVSWLTTQKEWESYLESHPTTRARNSANGSWTAMGPINLPNNGTGQPNGNGRINCIAFHPTNSSTIYIGAASGGIWKSANYGNSWSDISSNLTSLGVSSIIVDPDDPNQIIIGTGDRDGGDAPGYGVWKTTNGGSSWSAWNTGMGNRTVYEIIMDPSNHDILIAATNARIYRSTNRGANWTQVFSGHSCKDIDFKPGISDYVYASGQNVYRSTDNGVSWNQITAGTPVSPQRIALTVSADNPNYVYLLAGNGSGLQGLYRSTDSGANYTLRASSPNIFGYDTNGGTGSQAWYDIVIKADPNDADHLYTGAVNIWESFDGGQTFSIVTHWYGAGGNPSVHADQHSIEFHPVTGDLFSGNDGGIYYSSNAGASFTELTNGLDISQIYKIGQSQTQENYVIAGFQDNGTAILYDNNYWSTEVGGDGMECIIDPIDHTTMYTALYYGSVRRSTNTGSSFATIAANGTNGITQSGGWVTPYKLHPTDTDTMYIGYKDIWRSFNAGSAAANSVSWTKISNFGQTCTDLAISESNPNVMFFSTSSGGSFYKSTNVNAGSPSWTNITGNKPAGGTVKDIEIDPTDANHLWILIGNDIYESNNGGTAWSNFSGTLPNIGANCVVFDKNSTVEAMYIGMNVGIYYRDNTMSDWTAFSNGLPLVEVTELEIYYDSECSGYDKIVASTYGRGVQESNLKDPGNIAPDVCFYADLTEVCQNSTITFYDNSSYSPTSWTWVFSPNTVNFVNGTNANSQNPDVKFTNSGTYTVELTCSNSNGNGSKTKTNYITVISGTIPPISENFESGLACSTAIDCGTTTCSLPTGWNNLTNGADDNIDWRLDAGGTNSNGTGPSTDYNPGTSSGLYTYTEASGGCSGQIAIMESDCIDLSNTSISYELSYAYHMWGAAIGSLHVDAIVDGQIINDITSVVSGNQGNQWHTNTVNLSAYAGKSIVLRFRGITGTDFTSDIALDDIQVQPSGALPLELLSFSAEPGADNRALLNWASTNEINVDRFIIERSFDALEKEVIGEVSAVGYSTATEDYSYIDESPGIGENYYRLKMVDFDGQFKYSNWEVVNFDGPSELTMSDLIPNPFENSSRFTIRGGRGKYTEVKLKDQMGRIVKNIYAGNMAEGQQTFTIEKESLPAGLYYLQVKCGNINLMQKAIIF